MPRLNFLTEAVFLVWARKFVNDKKYVVYFIMREGSREFVAYPIKTSRPITYGCYKPKPTDDEKKIRDFFLNDLQVEVFDLASLDWDTERVM